VLLELGDHSFDISTRALVVGILNRTPDSFFDGGDYFGFDEFLAKAEQHVTDGADVVDIGGIRLKPGDEVGVEEELERVVPSVQALAERFDVPISVDTFRAQVAAACFDAGASIANDTSGFADPEMLHVAAEAGATVVASHVRTAPRLADPNPIYADVVTDVTNYLAERAGWAEAAGIPRQRIILNHALDLGKNAEMSTKLLFSGTCQIAELGYPTFLSASNKGFLGIITGDPVANRDDATHAAHVAGIMAGARVLRAHNVKGTRRLADTVSLLLETRGVAAPDGVEFAGTSA
jgi:dihydropteroate synthase